MWTCGHAPETDTRATLTLPLSCNANVGPVDNSSGYAMTCIMVNVTVHPITLPY